MIGRVIKSTGSWYSVLCDDQTVVECRIRGNLRLSGIRTTNPVAVGDMVRIARAKDDESWMIEGIQERHNYIIRKSPKNRRARQIIAANIDQAILVVTMSQPRTSTGFVDRFLATAEAYNIPSVLVFNKCDLYTEKDIQLLEDFMITYQSLDYPCYVVSSITGHGMDTVEAMMKDKISVISGHSGVGKSTFINALDEQLGLRTKPLSGYHNKGQHTTTHPEMFLLPQGGYIIDTPGIKEFGLLDIKEEELGDFFREFAAISGQCKYNNCKHINEPNCAVKDALEQYEIDPTRYQNYLNMVDDIRNGLKHWE